MAPGKAILPDDVRVTVLVELSAENVIFPDPVKEVVLEPVPSNAMLPATVFVPAAWVIPAALFSVRSPVAVVALIAKPPAVSKMVMFLPVAPTVVKST